MRNSCERAAFPYTMWNSPQAVFARESAREVCLRRFVFTLYLPCIYRVVTKYLLCTYCVLLPLSPPAENANQRHPQAKMVKNDSSFVSFAEHAKSGHSACSKVFGMTEIRYSALLRAISETETKQTGQQDITAKYTAIYRRQ